MRLDRLLPLAAAALVAACNPQSAERTSGAARAPIPAAQPSTAQPPAAQAAKADCPCPKGAKAKAEPRRKAIVHKASHKAAAHPHRRTYRRYEALAGGPPSRSEYARVPPGYYEDGPATSYRYGPAYPPAPAYRDDDYGRRHSYHYERRDEGRYDDRRSGYEERGGRYEDRRNGYEDRRAWREPAPPPPPPPADRYGPEREQRWEDGRSYEGGAAYNEGYSSHDDYVRREPPPPPAARHGYSERRAYEQRSESSSSYESRSESRGGPCCRSEAAGFDAHGFLTWPGKVPARP
jgi:hypothetical protein